MSRLADTIPSPSKLKRNALILPSFVLGCIPVLGIPVTIIFPSTLLYLVFFLPLGLVAAVLAWIAIHQVKRTPGTRGQRNLAMLAYFLGLSPILYFCGQITYQVFALQ
jgi:hypothetical protein